jgi:hypothetical protein
MSTKSVMILYSRKNFTIANFNWLRSHHLKIKDIFGTCRLIFSQNLPVLRVIQFLKFPIIQAFDDRNYKAKTNDNLNQQLCRSYSWMSAI